MTATPKIHRFTVSGIPYISTGMSAMEQFHLAKRLGGAAGLLGDLNREAFPQSFVLPFIFAVGNRSDADADYIVNSCLEKTQRHVSGTAPAPLFQNGQQMFQDIEMNDMLQIVGQVLEANLSGFFAELRSKLLPPKDPSSDVSQAGKTGSSAP